jgi:hypothetical protein
VGLSSFSCFFLSNLRRSSSLLISREGGGNCKHNKKLMMRQNGVGEWGKWAMMSGEVGGEEQQQEEEGIEVEGRGTEKVEGRIEKMKGLEEERPKG